MSRPPTVRVPVPKEIETELRPAVRQPESRSQTAENRCSRLLAANPYPDRDLKTSDQPADSGRLPLRHHATGRLLPLISRAETMRVALLATTEEGRDLRRW